jgi:hypothetical protein
MKKVIILIIIAVVVIIAVILGISNHYNQKRMIKKWTDYNSSAGISWDCEVIPEGNLEQLPNRFFLVSPISGRDQWRFKSIKPGTVTICWFYYTGGLTLEPDNSYAQDYIIHDNLEIEEIGKHYPVWEVVESRTIREYYESISTSLTHLLTDRYNEFEDVTYEVSYDTELKKFYITAYNTHYNGEDVKKFVHDYTLRIFSQQGNIFADYSVDVTVVE